MSVAAEPLSHVVAHAGYALARVAPYLRPPPKDPFAIDLPPAVGGALTPAALTQLGALYLFSQLDGAGVIVAVEAIVEARADLSLRDDRSAEAVEKFALDARGFPGRTEREAVYARLFGSGGQASLAGSANHDFSSQLAAICTAILHIADDMRLAHARPSAGMYVPLQYAVEQLIEGLALHTGADVTYRTQRIHTMLARAIAILDLDGIKSYFGGQSAADVVRVILGEDAPSLRSAQRRGLAGQQIIVACGRATGRGGAAASLVTSPNDPIVSSATTWLAESGGSTPALAPSTPGPSAGAPS